MTSLRQFVAVLLIGGLGLAAGAAHGQSGGKPAEGQKPATDAATKESQKEIDDMAEAGRVLNGAAGNPECVWIGERVVGRLASDDLDAAFRHLDLYDRFGCPSAHIQAAFRCMARQGRPNLKQQADFNGRVRACWLNPGLPPAPATAAAQAPAPSGGTGKP